MAQTHRMNKQLFIITNKAKQSMATAKGLAISLPLMHTLPFFILRVTAV